MIMTRYAHWHQYLFSKNISILVTCVWIIHPSIFISLFSKWMANIKKCVD